MTNQEALNVVKVFISHVWVASPELNDKKDKCITTLQKAIDDLELYNKEKEIAKRIFNNPDLCYTEEEQFLEYIEEKARKELENEN